jgi:hypothetical protein
MKKMKSYIKFWFKLLARHLLHLNGLRLREPNVFKGLEFTLKFSFFIDLKWEKYMP